MTLFPKCHCSIGVDSRDGIYYSLPLSAVVCLECLAQRGVLGTVLQDVLHRVSAAHKKERSARLLCVDTPPLS